MEMHKEKKKLSWKMGDHQIKKLMVSLLSTLHKI